MPATSASGRAQGPEAVLELRAVGWDGADNNLAYRASGRQPLPSAGRVAERAAASVAAGVLARTFPAAVLDEVIEAAGVREARYRRLPARLMMVFTLATRSPP